MSAINDILRRKVIVCVGTGGVGKTTVSATLAVAAAAQGRRTLVMTIDPARRLASALGLSDIGNVETEIKPERLAPYGVQLTAPLWVMMPDVKRTFDDLVARWAPSMESRNKILNNRIYQHFSTALVGSLEYAAVEKLYEVYASGKYDLIVLDTPPSQNALDFLDAPNRISDFLEQDSLQWLLKPSLFAGKFSLKVFDFGTALMQRTLGNMAGTETLRELAEFILGFQGMYEGFRERSQKVKHLLASPELAFVLVGSTHPTQQLSMLHFRDALEKSGLPIRMLILNRVRQLATTLGSEINPRELIAKYVQGPDADRLGAAVEEEISLDRIDVQACKDLRLVFNNIPLLALPELVLDVNDLENLARLQKLASTAQAF